MNIEDSYKIIAIDSGFLSDNLMRTVIRDIPYSFIVSRIESTWVTRLDSFIKGMQILPNDTKVEKKMTLCNFLQTVGLFKPIWNDFYNMYTANNSAFFLKSIIKEISTELNVDEIEWTKLLENEKKLIYIPKKTLSIFTRDDIIRVISLVGITYEWSKITSSIDIIDIAILNSTDKQKELLIEALGLDDPENIKIPRLNSLVENALINYKKKIIENKKKFI